MSGKRFFTKIKLRRRNKTNAQDENRLFSTILYNLRVISYNTNIIMRRRLWAVIVDYTLMGNRMKMKRRSKKLSQKELAKAVRVSPSFYGNIERGLRVPSVDTLVAIANALGVGLDFLLADSLTNGTDRHTPEEMAVLFRYLRERIEELDYGTVDDTPRDTLDADLEKDPLDTQQ